MKKGEQVEENGKADSEAKVWNGSDLLLGNDYGLLCMCTMTHSLHEVQSIKLRYSLLLCVLHTHSNDRVVEPRAIRDS